MPLSPLETLQRLVRTPSINPMGREIAGPQIGESRMTDLLVEIARDQGWRWSRQPVHPGRDNLLIIVDGHPSPAAGGELLLWDVHQDTVPVDGMTIDPFAAEVREGRVYGRGACDVKGAMAAMLAALSRLDAGASSAVDRPTIVMACTANEECGFTGARALATLWPRSEIFARLPDAAIVAEPTEHQVVVAHQGVVRWRCHTLGRAAHSSRPDEGVNAIYGMARVVEAIERYQVEMLSAATGHPLCGRPSVCVSTIHGGAGVNTVPDRATIEIDRRISPGDRPEAAQEELAKYIAREADVGLCRILHDPPFMQSVGLDDADNRALAERVAAAARKHGGGGEVVGVSFGTDAAAIAAAGVPTVVFGPGSIAQAHTADEYLALDELERATSIFYEIALRGLR